MSDIQLNAGTGGAFLGTDQVAGTPNIDYQIVKLGFSVAGSTPTQVSATNPLPDNLTQVGGNAVKTGSGNGSTGSLNVYLATDQPALTNALKVDPSGVTSPISGTVTANIGTTNGLALDASVSGLSLAQASTTSGQKGALVQGAVTTAAPTYTTAQTSPLSLNISGGLRVDGSGVTQPVSGTFWQATQPVSGTITANAGSGTFAISAASLPLPSGAAADTSVNGILVSQGSTTSGEKGPLIQGAVTTGAPTYTTAQTSPLSLTTGGLLRVDASGATQPVSGTVTANQGGTWTVQPGNTANTTPWLVQSVPATSGGLSSTTIVSAASNNLTQIKASAGQLYFAHAGNINASPRYVKVFYLPSASVTMGTTRADAQFMIPGNTAGAGFVVPIEKGIGGGGSGLTIAITGGISLTDNTSISANEVCLTLGYD